MMTMMMIMITMRMKIRLLIYREKKKVFSGLVLGLFWEGGTIWPHLYSDMKVFPSLPGCLCTWTSTEVALLVPDD